MGRSWEEVQREFRMLVLRRGDRTIEDFAREIPASRKTIYRLMRGEVREPSMALRAGVERVCQVTQSSVPDSGD